MFNRFFNWLKTTKDEPNIRFGRYSDAYKTEKQYAYWDQSTKAFEEKNYLDAYSAFFNYLRDEEEDNLNFTEAIDHINFEITQGSKVIKGKATKDKVVASAEVVKVKRLTVAFMRKLMEVNYNLQYSRFALKDKIISIKFDTSVIDGSPDKLYFALKELGTRADRYDDWLVHEFPTALASINNQHIKELPESEKEIKFKYLQSWIEKVLEQVEKLDHNKFAGGIAYMLLNLAYKIDYLITPEGKLMERVERIHKMYFANNDLTVIEKIDRMVRDFKEIQDMLKEEVFEELYLVKATFGITNPTLPQQISDLIIKESQRMIWHRDNNHLDIALNILEYICQYSLFYFGMPRPTEMLFQMLVRMLNAGFYQELGFEQTYYNANTSQFDTSAIKRKIAEVQKEARTRYPNFKINTSKLRYDSLVNFVYSLLTEMSKINYSRQ